MHAIENYLTTFEELRRRKRWSTDTTILRYAALSLATAEIADPAGELERVAEELRRRADWFGPLRSPVRYAVAAMLIRRGVPAGRTHDAVRRTRETFRAVKLRRAGVQEVLAAFMLVLNNDGRPAARVTALRMKQILERWNRDHPWLTGHDDYPMAALHATRDEGVEAFGTRVESIYQRLREAKFSRGNQLQLASHILSIADWSGAEAARRATALRDAFVSRKQRIGTDQYDEVALLCLTPGGPAQIAQNVLAYRDRLREVKPRPQKSVAFSLAAGVVLGESADRADGLTDSRDLATLKAVQAILDAQAAAMAAVVATTAATSAATS